MFHCSIKIIGRNSGRSAVASAAYRSGEELYNAETGLVHDFTKKGGVVMTEIMLPDNAPAEYADRATLWNEVQKIEKRSDAQLAREVEVAFPVEMSRDQQIECLRNYVQDNFVSKGMCADWAIHDKSDGNPHAHIMLTVRGFDENGKWISKQKSVFAIDEKGEKIPQIDPSTGKQRVRVREGKGEEKLWLRVSIPSNDWNDHKKAEEWRESWAVHCNRYLETDKQIDHRSYERQGIDLEPTIHEGFAARQIEERGAVSDKCEANHQIRKRNTLHQELKARAIEITNTIKKKARNLIDRYDEFRRSAGYPRTPGRDDGTDRGDGSSTAGEGRRNFGISEFVEVIHRTESEIAAADRFIEEFREKINQSAEAIGERLTAVKKHQRVSVRSKLNEYQKIVNEQEKESKAIEPEIRRKRGKSR